MWCEAVVDSLRAWPAAARLDDPMLMVEAARALAGGAVVNRHRALALYGV